MPKRGEVFRVDMGPAPGVEKAGRGPALNVQNDRGNEFSAYAVAAALSSSDLPRVHPFSVAFKAGEANLKEGGACKLRAACDDRPGAAG